MQQKVWVLCSDGEENLAEQLLEPLRKAGYDATHEGDIAVGDSLVAKMHQALEQKVPIVVCATRRSVGSAWTHKVLNAANMDSDSRIFVVTMEKDTFTSALPFPGRVSNYASDPSKSIKELIESIQGWFPLTSATAPTTAQSHSGEDKLRALNKDVENLGVDAYLDQLTSLRSFDVEAINRFRSEIRPELVQRISSVGNEWNFLEHLGVMRDGRLTRTGALLFADEPTDAVPTAVVQCVHYGGVNRSASREVAHVLGSVAEQIVEARQFVADRTVRSEKPVAGQAQAALQYAYPMIAVREVLANAVVHRDYADASANVHVRLYDDRLEVSSPGDWPGFSLEEDQERTLDTLEGQSVKRNFRLARLLSWIRLVEGEGSGIPAAVDDCKRSGAAIPRVSRHRGFVTVTLTPIPIRQPDPIKTRLNPIYTFDNFVVGAHNRFAHAAAVAVAQAPATAYNPLFIYGESGLGKTHLLHAIGHYAQNLYPGIGVRYVNSEEFTNDFINSIRDDKAQAFQRRYRDVDVLLIDDIQFLSNKVQIQEEFFYTFNTLHNANKQVVITSDMPPKQLSGFEERMRSRFEWGLITDVQPPDLETRIAILHKKAVGERLAAPDDVLEYIASKISSNTRELEGALNRVTAFASLNRQPVDMQLAEIVLRDLISNDETTDANVELILDETASYFSVTVEDLCGTSRSRTLVTARQIAMYLCRELTELSLSKIGQHFGGRDHMNVMHAERKIRMQMAERRSTYNQVTELINRIKNRTQRG